MTSSTPSKQLPTRQPLSRVIATRRFFLRRALLGTALLTAGSGSWGSLLQASSEAAQSKAAQSDPTLYVVKPGDSLSRIASRHGTTVSTLRRLNGIEGDFLKPGQVLRLSESLAADYPHLACCEESLMDTKPSRRQWKRVILHHSATAMGSARAFDTNHRRVRRMENGLAYHFVIGNGRGSPDGHVEVGNRWTQQLQGGHVKSVALNEVSIGICLVGNFEQSVPTDSQIAAAEDLVRYLMERAVPGQVDLCLHRDLEATLCPGRLFPASRFRSLVKS